jgi:hypothetical protein
MPEFRRNEETRNPSLTTADLANADANADLANLDEPLSIDGNRERELQRPDSPRRELDADEPSIYRTSAAKASAIETASENGTAPLFSPEESKGLHAQWDAIQVSFVDEPRQAVQQADGLVASAMQRLAEIFADERGHLDEQWDRGGDVSTEDLRIALRRYRSFFGRLLSV